MSSTEPDNYELNRTGQTSAVVEIRLDNTGDRSYR